MLSFGNVVLCEDIRPERFNKHSLMGVYSGNIIVAEMPATIQVAIYVEYRNGTAGDKVQFDGTLGKAKLNAEFVVEEGFADGTILFARSLVKFEKDGRIKMRASINGGRKRTLIDKTVTEGELPGL